MKQWTSPDIKELSFSNTYGKGRHNSFSWRWFFTWSTPYTPHKCNSTSTPTPPPTSIDPPELS